jgi:hypothetical protein
MASYRLSAINFVPKLFRKKSAFISKLEYESQGEVEDFEANQHLLDESRQSQLMSSRSRWTSVQVSLLLMIAGLIAYISVSLLLFLQSSRVVTGGRGSYGDCGTNPQEAIAKGCKFDISMWAWERPECYDEELINDFIARTDWHFYSNDTLEPTYELPLDRVARGDYPRVYTEQKYHMIHCTYTWRKVHKALEGNLTLDHVAIPYSHTRHCEKVLLIDITHEAHCGKSPLCATRLDAIYARCGYV